MTLSQYGQKIIEQEAKAIAALSSIIDSNFELAVKTISEMQPGGKVVISGMGKAGFIAMKISATLASLGIPSFFLHPAEAIHGDLGRYTKNDVAIVLSNSGETPEILRILPHIKRIGCPLISITGSSSSNLAKHSDIVIAYGKIEEAGPLGLAPTTSTIVMLAIGDALAMTLVESKGFSPEQFAFFHPGGDLGKSLTCVSEIMRSGENNCVVPSTMIVRDVIHKISITKGRPGAACVVDESGKLFGIFTDGNLRRCLESNTEFLDKPISNYATRNPKTIHKDKLAQEALRIMSEHEIDQLLIVDENGALLGMLDVQDVIGY